MRIMALLLFICLSSQAKIGITEIAAGTTIAVNVGLFAKWVGHPKREVRKTIKQVKDELGRKDNGSNQPKQNSGHN